MVYLVIRAVDCSPLGKKVYKFEAPSLLEWVQEAWDSVSALGRFEDEDEEYEYLEDTYPFVEKQLKVSEWEVVQFFNRMRCCSKPESLDDLASFIADFGRYGEGSINMDDRCIHAVTDDDEIEIEWYLFDEEYKNATEHVTSFLLHETFELPSGAGSGKFAPVLNEYRSSSSHPVTYVAMITYVDGLTITDCTGNHILLGDLSTSLSQLTEEPNDQRKKKLLNNLPNDLLLFRALLIEADGDVVQAFEAMKGFMRKGGRWPVRELDNYKYKHNDYFIGNKSALKKDLAHLRTLVKEADKKSNYKWKISLGSCEVQESEHILQMLFTSKLETDANQKKPTESVYQWVFFDSYWAVQNPKLAESILRFARGEDMCR